MHPSKTTKTPAPLSIALKGNIKLHNHHDISRGVGFRIYHQSPWSFMAAATLVKPAMLDPVTREGRTPSAGVAYS